MAQQGPEQALVLGQPGMEAQPGAAPSQATPRGNFVSVKFTQEVFAAFAAKLLVVSQIFGPWDGCRSSHLFLSCFQSRRETVPGAACPLLGVIPSSREALLMPAQQREPSQGFGDSRGANWSSASSPGSEQAPSQQESRAGSVPCTAPLPLEIPGARQPWCLLHIPPASLPAQAGPTSLAKRPRAVITEQCKLRSGS